FCVGCDARTFAASSISPIAKAVCKATSGSRDGDAGAGDAGAGDGDAGAGDGDAGAGDGDAGAEQSLVGPPLAVHVVFVGPGLSTSCVSPDNEPAEMVASYSPSRFLPSERLKFQVTMTSTWSPVTLPVK